MVQETSSQPNKKSAIMSRYHAQYQKVLADFSRILLGAVVVLTASACAKRTDIPDPTQSPPRPTTWAGHVFTAQLDLSARPRPASPGEM
jgi:hypothetical protein